MGSRGRRRLIVLGRFIGLFFSRRNGARGLDPAICSTSTHSAYMHYSASLDACA